MINTSTQMKTINSQNNILNSINHFQTQSMKTMTQIYYFHVLNFELIQDGPFRGCLPITEEERPPYLESVTYPILMKLCTVLSYLKKIQKTCYVTHPFSSADMSISHQKSANFVKSRK